MGQGKYRHPVPSPKPKYQSDFSDTIASALPPQKSASEPNSIPVSVYNQPPHIPIEKGGTGEMRDLSFRDRLLRSSVLNGPMVNSTLIDARSYCARVLGEAGSMGPFTVQRMVVFPWETREEPEAVG